MEPDEIQQNEKTAEQIRKQLGKLYGEEPAIEEEIEDVSDETDDLSKHQRFVYKLSHSGKSPDDIEAAWHQYYAGLSDNDKHEVWREFQENSNTQESVHNESTEINSSKPSQNHTRVIDEPVVIPRNQFIRPTYYDEEPQPKHSRNRSTKTVSEIKRQLIGNIESRQKLKPKQHLKSLIFGLSVGSIFVLFLLFGFFNERFIAPFITPSRSVSSTPIIVDDSGIAISKEPKIIIPKINVEAPVVYDEPSIEEKVLQTALQRGTVHYATTPLPGEKGNVVIFGHSSSNLLNQGKYKYAFVLLSRMSIGDIFYLTKDGQRFSYKIYEKKIVSPTAVEVIGTASKPETATLITCDPPGSSLNRLVIIGEQISPDPNLNIAATTQTITPAKTTLPTILPSNSPTLWSRIKNWL